MVPIISGLVKFLALVPRDFTRAGFRQNWIDPAGCTHDMG